MTYHFIGLGGIGMSALARILLQRGSAVKGSDIKSSRILQELEKEGAKVQIGHSAEAIVGTETIVYSTDIKEDNVEWLSAKEKNLPMMHRSDLLDALMKGKKNLLVTGTHGKTTTTALLAAVLMEAGLDPSFVVGGLVRSLNTNGKAGKGEYFVAEADESDGSFLKTPAHAAILTNLDDDHLDYWGSSRVLDLAFQQFIAQTENLFWCCDDPRLCTLKTKGTSYGFSEKADLRITNFRQSKNGIIFNLNQTKDIELSLFGKHNALNGAAVFGLACSLNIPESAIRKAFREFLGTARRLEWKGEKHKVVVYDDYGHHPNEIRATIKALRDHVRERRLVVVFQPHRYTRVRDLFEDFTNCFKDADEVMMTDIYSAGEQPIPGITSATLYAKMREKLGTKVHFFPRTHLESGVASFLKPLDVVLTIGAGDITQAGEPILNLFAARAPKLSVAVLCGGQSAEHPVSLMSAKNIVKALDPSVYDLKLFGITKEGEWRKGFELDAPLAGPKITSEIISELMKCDVCIPVFHGPRGEDGMIAGLLDALQIPYVGCDYRSGSICMHKGWTKQVVVHHNVPIVPFFTQMRSSYNPQELIKKIEENFVYPVWIKPVHLGSSIGVTRAANSEEAIRSAEFAFGYDDEIIVEKEVVGRQIEFSVLGNERVQIALPGEIVNHGDFVAYDKKYGSGAMEIRVPAAITENEKEIGYELAERVYRACGCKGLARVDFFLDTQGYFWFNEINPFPGCTDTSAFPKSWTVSGMAMPQVVDELVALGLNRSLKR
ncbi:MAG: UDP-N-acetylmuramate--L-alanine ligase [Parachlamydiales bacterium]|nr:UDP-N-acetylmuramate--L-alanine ligase [Parachlamydiales bacterium]